MPDDAYFFLASCCELIHELAAISDQWIELGKHLNIPLPVMKKIECDTVRLERRQAKLFQYWVKNETEPTWQKVVDALEAIGEVELASKLTKKYITTFQCPTSNSQPVGSRGRNNVRTSVIFRTFY